MPDFLSVRELEVKDIEAITQYWLSSDKNFLKGMGVDLSKIPSKEEWFIMLQEQLLQPIPEKKSYCIIWMLNNKAVGHSNINKIVFGEEAYMHIHIWEGDVRQKGFGTRFIKLSLPFFFENYQLQKLYCEPYALNPGPNNVLKKLGFEYLRSYITTPGWLNFEQQVNLWQLTNEKFRFLIDSHE